MWSSMETRTHSSPRCSTFGYMRRRERHESLFTDIFISTEWLGEITVWALSHDMSILPSDAKKKYLRISSTCLYLPSALLPMSSSVIWFILCSQKTLCFCGNFALETSRITSLIYLFKLFTGKICRLRPKPTLALLVCLYFLASFFRTTA